MWAGWQTRKRQRNLHWAKMGLQIELGCCWREIGVGDGHVTGNFRRWDVLESKFEVKGSSPAGIPEAAGQANRGELEYWGCQVRLRHTFVHYGPGTWAAKAMGIPPGNRRLG